MAQLLTGPFNAMMYDPEMGVPQLPLGMKQPMRIIAEEVKAVKGSDNNGYIEFTVEILDGANKGSQGAYRLNIYHGDDKTKEFAMRQLSALSIACGKPTWQDTRELFNLPFLADVTPQKETEANKDKGYTQISAVYDVQGNKPKRGGTVGQNTNQNTQQNNSGNGGGDWNTNQNQNQNQQQNNNQQQQNTQDNTQQQNNQQSNNSDWNTQQNNTQQQGNNSNTNGGGNTPPWMQNKS